MSWICDKVAPYCTTSPINRLHSSGSDLGSVVKVPSPLARIWKSERRIQETEEDSTLVTLQWSRTEPPAQGTVNIMVWSCIQIGNSYLF